MALYIICMLLVLRCVSAQEKTRNDGFINSLHSGMKFAQHFLGSESIAQNVAEFIVRAFQPTKPRPTANRRHPNEDFNDDDKNQSESKPFAEVNGAENPMNGLKHLVRLFGLQPNQISAVAINALVFVAQMITTFLAGPKRPSRHYKFEETSSWILNKNSRALQDILSTAKNESLSDLIENLIKDNGAGEDTSCIQLLACKITPFVNKMQRTVFGNDTTNDKVQNDKDVRGVSIMYRHLPTETEINERGDICERKYRDCDLNE